MQTVRGADALVLSGGCLRGMAQIGVLKALASAGIRPRLVVGTSVGAIVGGLFAAGLTPAEIEHAAVSLDVARLKRWTLSRLGVWSTLGMRTLLRQLLPCERIEAMPTRFAAVATDLMAGSPVVLASGDPVDAIVASAAMPGFFVPPRIGGRTYVDGCLVSPLPVGIARALGAERVIAVSTLFDPRGQRATGCLGALMHCPRLLMYALAEQEAAGADLVIAPRLPPEPGVTRSEFQALIDQGEREAAAVLRGLPALPHRITVTATRRPMRMAKSPTPAHRLTAFRPEPLLYSGEHPSDRLTHCDLRL